MIDASLYTGDWDYATLPANIRIGRDCYIERRESFTRFASARDPALVLGDRVHIYTWSAFSLDQDGLVEVGDDATLVGAQFMCAEHITVGRRVIVSYNVLIADCDFHPRDPELRRLDAIANAPGPGRPARPRLSSRPVLIEDDVVVGAGAMILKGVRIGRGAYVQAGAVVTSDVAPGSRVAGNPAHVVPA